MHTLATLLITCCLACGPATHEHGEELQESAPGTTAKADGEHGQAHEEVAVGIPEVTLNNGARWSANPETMQGIANMTKLAAAYDPSKDDAKAFKAALEEEFGLIFERCTMTGEAHEQLHNYLLPIHQRLRDMDASKPEDVEDLRTYLATYGNYFE